MSSNLTVLIININSTWTVLLLKLNIGCERFYLCRLFTIDLFKPKIVTGQYNSRTGISNVIIPGGRGKWSLNRKNSEKYWISNIKRNLVLKYNIYIYTCVYAWNLISPIIAEINYSFFQLIYGHFSNIFLFDLLYKRFLATLIMLDVTLFPW
jgi:hypothetical protein